MAKKRQTGKDTEFAYTITDKIYGEFKVLNSANAWWLDKVKVENLITAYKYDAPDEEAIISAGITTENLRYFKELHPDFSRIKATCKEVPNLKARQTVVNKSSESYSNAMDYLKRKKKLEFGDNTDVTSGGNPLQITFDETFRATSSKTKGNSS